MGFNATSKGRMAFFGTLIPLSQQQSTTHAQQRATERHWRHWWQWHL
jgi:hypothetical protein